MPTDVLCNIIEEHQLLNHHKPSSDPILKPVSSQQATNGMLKNTRSASLPLKILLNENDGCTFNRYKRLPVNNYRFSSTKELIRSWSGMDTFLMNQLAKKNDSTNNNSNETNFILYARFSLSEHFLNLIDEDQVAHENLRRLERNASLLSNNKINNESTKENIEKTTNDEEDDEEAISSSPLLSESSTLGGEDVVQFVLDTENDSNPSSHSTVRSFSSPSTVDDEENDINNNERFEYEQDDGKQFCGDKLFDYEEEAAATAELNDSHDRCFSSEFEKQESKTNKSDEDSMLNNNDLDQTITYEQLNEISDSANLNSSNTGDNNNSDDLMLTRVNNAHLINATSNENQQSSPIHAQIEGETKNPSFSTFYASNNNSNDTFNLKELNSNLTSSFNNNNSDCESSGINSSMCSTTHNESISTSPPTPTVESCSVSAANSMVGDENKERNSSSSPLSWSLGSSSSSMLNTSAITDEDEEDIFKNFMPKKSCLKKNKQDLYIDTSSSSGSGSSDPSENATSSPLVPATPTSPLSSSISSSPLFSSSSSSFQSPPNTSVTSSEMNRSKKRVSFADVCGKDLFTIRTMSEPSNCPPKLTSKIVQFFLNREFNQQQQQQQQQQQSSLKSCYGGRAGINEFNIYPNGNDFFSRTRNYGYGISTSNYTNDLNQLAGTIAVYSLNFAQPAADYFKFRQKISEQSVSLENVILNRFQINGTIKVKNIHFHKTVFVRCSFDKWTTHQDYIAHYVPWEYYSSGESMMSTSNTLLSSPTSHSVSASFYSSSGHHHHGHHHASSFQPPHKEFDTFRFEFELPKSPVDPTATIKNSPNASIQFCICFRTGDSTEYWDNNDGKNYEILQYVIDIESLKPQSKSPNADFSSSKSRNFKYEGANSRTLTNLLTPSTETSSNDVYY